MTITEIREAIVGKTKEEAFSILENAGISYRISSINGQARLLTADMKINRVNLSIEDNKIINFTMG